MARVAFALIKLLFPAYYILGHLISIVALKTVRAPDPLHRTRVDSRKAVGTCHSSLRLTSLAYDFIGAAVGAQQDDLSPLDMPVRGVAIQRQRGQTAAISGLENDGNSGSLPEPHLSRVRRELLLMARRRV